MSAYLETLNEQQKKAVTAPRGNCLVVAGAGTGKTRVVVSRIAYILKELKDPAYSVMAMTFTNKAAKELKTRLQELCQDVPHLERLWTGTFHGLCARFLRIYAAEAGLPDDYIILDSDGQKRQIADILRSEAFALSEIASVAKEKKRLNVLTHYIASVKEKGLTPDLLQRQLLKGERRLPAELSEIPGTEVAEVYRAYERLCDAAGLVDFTGLLLKTRDLFRNNPGLRRAQHQRLRHILVDEFQDTDRIQYELVQLLAGPECSVMVVGDDDQSIYSWRGADPRNMHSFVEDYVNTQVIPLARNYRSPQTILDVANAVIGHSSSRLTEKRLESERKEGHKVVIKALTGPNDEAQWVAATLRELHDREGIDCRLHVVPMEGWERGMFYDETGLLWVAPSPNLPTLDAAVLYNGTCLFEGTNISEGRGTTHPFENIGAPWIDPYKWKKEIGRYGFEGVYFRPMSFMPVASKYKGEVCNGLYVHVLDRMAFDPLKLGLAMVLSAKKLFPGDFRFTAPRHEIGDFTIDLMYGSPRARDDKAVIRDLFDEIDAYSEGFKKTSWKDYLLYD